MPGRARCRRQQAFGPEYAPGPARAVAASHGVPALVLGQDPRPRAHGRRFTCSPSARNRAADSSPSTREASSQPRTGRSSTSSSTAWTRPRPISTSGSGARAKGRSGSTTSSSKNWRSSTCSGGKGCPLSVKSSDGKTTYEEGRDFSPVVDPKLGRVPWEGEYEFDHAGPTITIKSGSRIKPGARLRVSWYHPVITHGSQMMCCLSDPKLMQILRDQAKRVNELFHPKTFFMSHDEIRVMNWCQACQQRGLTPGAASGRQRTPVHRDPEVGQSAGANRRLVRYVRPAPQRRRPILPGQRLAQGIVGGPVERDVIIANWNGGKAAESLQVLRRPRPSPVDRRLLRRSTT